MVCCPSRGLTVQRSTPPVERSRRRRAAGAIISAMSSATPYPVAARELLRNSLLDAAVRSSSATWGGVTMGDIAAPPASAARPCTRSSARAKRLRAGTRPARGRPLHRSGRRSIAEHVDDPRAAVSAALGVFLDAAASHPLIRNRGDRRWHGRAAAAVHHPGQPRAVPRRLAAGRILLEGWPQVARADAELFAECMVRLAVSLAALPDSPTGMTADSIASLFAPYIDQLLAAAARPIQ